MNLDRISHYTVWIRTRSGEYQKGTIGTVPIVSQNIEELCVCDADILAHFDNIPMLFNSAFNRHGVSLNEVREWMRASFEHDFDDLSDRTKEIFRERYNTIRSVILGDIQ